VTVRKVGASCWLIEHQWKYECITLTTSHLRSGFRRYPCVVGLSQSCLSMKPDSGGCSVAEHSRIRVLRSWAAYCGSGQSRCVAVASAEPWRSRGPSIRAGAT
jgi:hypothetical protein